MLADWQLEVLNLAALQGRLDFGQELVGRRRAIVDVEGRVDRVELIFQIGPLASRSKAQVFHDLLATIVEIFEQLDNKVGGVALGVEGIVRRQAVLTRPPALKEPLVRFTVPSGSRS